MLAWKSNIFGDVGYYGVELELNQVGLNQGVSLCCLFDCFDWWNERKWCKVLGDHVKSFLWWFGCKLEFDMI